MKEFIVPAIIEQHIHGGFGVNFNTCNLEDVLYFLEKIKSYGVSKVYPTLHTDSIEILNRQLKIIYEASKEKSEVEIMGVHLEGPFINPNKAGVHNPDIIKVPNMKDYRDIVGNVDEDFIKIVTLAPELDKNLELTKYLTQKGVVVSAGHTLTNDLSMVKQVTHLFNAMGGVSHKENMTAAQALINDNIYTEVIADGNHIVDDVKAGKISDLAEKIRSFGEAKAADLCQMGLPTLHDLVAELMKPGRDIRDSLPQPILRTDVLHTEDLKPGMILSGTVRNVIDFGAFVDIGVHQDGLVHISKLCDKFVRHPSEVVTVGDVVKVVVLDVDIAKKRISLSMRDVPKE